MGQTKPEWLAVKMIVTKMMILAYSAYIQTQKIMIKCDPRRNSKEPLPCSQTKDSFRDPGVRVKRDEDYSTRFSTNFISHSDSKCLSYRTTNQELFTKENAMTFDRQVQKSLMTSSVPSGDRDKVPLPPSEMQGNYHPHSVDHIKPTRYPNYRDNTLSDTLRTDRRFPPNYASTNAQAYDGEFVAAERQGYGEAALRRGRHYNELGDGMSSNHSTNVRDAYQHPQIKPTGYNKTEALKKVLGSTLVLGTAGEGSKLEGVTTNHLHFQGLSEGPAQSVKPDNVFESHFTEGDRNPERIQQDQNSTCYGSFFFNRAPGQVVNPKVRGEEILTKSRVVIGTEHVPLTASTASCYQPHTQHIKPRERIDQRVKFRRGFEFGTLKPGEDDPVSSTVKSDFKDPCGTSKCILDAVVLDRIKNSHISLVDTKVTPEYSSTYKDRFISEQGEKRSLAPRLQSSSIPMGTFSKFMTNPDNPR